MDNSKTINGKEENVVEFDIEINSQSAEYNYGVTEFPEEENVVEFDLDIDSHGTEFENIEFDASGVEEYTRQQEAAHIQHVRSAREEKDAKKTHMSQKTKRTISNTIIHIVLAVLSALWILPFIFIVFESFRVESTGLAGYIIPKQWGFDNYIRLFTETEFLRWFLSTFIIGLVCAVVQTLFILAMSYALSRNRFKGRKFLMNLMLILGMFPGFLTLILLYTLLDGWGMTGANAPYGLIIIYVASSGMGYYVCKGFFDTISHSLDEAAMIDGASKLQIFYKIIIPMSKPIIIYTILMGFMGPWGDFVTARFMSNNDPLGFNVATGLQWLIGETRVDKYYTTFCAGGVVVALPITLLFMFLQKYYVAGVTGGAVKG